MMLHYRQQGRSEDRTSAFTTRVSRGCIAAGANSDTSRSCRTHASPVAKEEAQNAEEACKRLANPIPACQRLASVCALWFVIGTLQVLHHWSTMMQEEREFGMGGHLTNSLMIV